MIKYSMILFVIVGITLGTINKTKPELLPDFLQPETTGPGKVKALNFLGSNIHWGSDTKDFQLIYQANNGDVKSFIFHTRKPPSVWAEMEVKNIHYIKSPGLGCPATHSIIKIESF